MTDETPEVDMTRLVVGLAVRRHISLGRDLTRDELEVVVHDALFAWGCAKFCTGEHRNGVCPQAGLTHADLVEQGLLVAAADAVTVWLDRRSGP